MESPIAKPDPEVAIAEVIPAGVFLVQLKVVPVTPLLVPKTILFIVKPEPILGELDMAVATGIGFIVTVAVIELPAQ
jgi:hypothetical protein